MAVHPSNYQSCAAIGDGMYAGTVVAIATSTRLYKEGAVNPVLDKEKN